jgi:hypothetical protein
MCPDKLTIEDTRPGVMSKSRAKFVERLAKLPNGWEGLREKS